MCISVQAQSTCSAEENNETDTIDIPSSLARKIAVSNQITKSEIQVMTGISIKLRATVVQSSGFADPEAAWNSVAAKEG